MLRKRNAWKLAALLSSVASFASAGPATASEATALNTPAGQPKIRLDRLDFPSDVAGSSAFKKHLRQTLRREVRRVEWGAGRDNRIEYRFAVVKLLITTQDGVLKVSCSAKGTLPGGKTARSQLSFGGHPSQRNQVVKQVLDIVARGVITRLAELERRRRGLS